MYCAKNHAQSVVVEDDDDGDCRQLVVVVLVLVTLRVAVVGDVAFQRYLLAQSHVTVTTATTSQRSRKRGLKT